MRYSPLERRRRRISRWALYGSLVLIAAVLIVFLTAIRRTLPRSLSQPWAHVDYEKLRDVQLLQRYVRINTSPSGNEVAGAEFLASIIRKAGIPATVEHVGPHNANVWAILEGRNPNALVLHSHIDVEAINKPKKWHYPPFGGVIRGPWIFGRGAFDMKSIGIAQLLAFLHLKQEGAPLDRSVIFLATSGEESGSDLGARWWIREHPDLVKRSWALLTEGGGVEGRNIDNVKYLGVSFAQRKYVDVHICSRDRRRLTQIEQTLTWVGRPLEPLEVTPEVREFLDDYAPTRDRPDLRRWLSDPEEITHNLNALLQLPPFLQSMFRDEALPYSLSKTPNGWDLDIKIHLLPGSSFAPARRRLLPNWLLFGLPWTVIDDGSADHGSPLDHPAFHAIVETLQEAYPGVVVGPYFLPWTATDARFFRAAGIPSYGFSPFMILTSDTMTVHGPNERIALPGFHRGVGIYRKLVQRIAM